MHNGNGDNVKTYSDNVKIQHLPFLFSVSAKQTEIVHLDGEWVRIPASIKGLFEIIGHFDRNLGKKVLKRYKLLRKLIELSQISECEPIDDHPYEDEQNMLGIGIKCLRLFLTETIIGNKINVDFRVYYGDGGIICIELNRNDGGTFNVVGKFSNSVQVIDDNWDDAIGQCLRGRLQT